MRGSLKLFTDVIQTPTPPVMTVTKQGRSADLHNLRNECLVDRYYFYLNFTDKRYTSILDILSREFFIAQFTIQERLDENYERLIQIKSESPQKSHFARKWPHLVWQ